MASNFGHDTKAMERTRIAGLPVVTAGRAELVDAMIADCRRARADETVPATLIFDINGHGISMAGSDPAYRRALEAADLIHADGGIWVAMSRFTDAPIAERSSTTDMMTDFAAACEREGLTFYILGGAEPINAAFIDFLARNYPKLKVVGRRNGYFGAADEAAVIADINAVRPDVLWVGMGKPREQQFCVNHRNSIKAGWVVTCGGCYNYFVGEYKRAPMWMQNANLEWLHRMATEPRKFGWRYLTTNPHSLALGLIDLAKLRLTKRKSARR